MKACLNIESEIIVIDNNSTDGSIEFLEQAFPSVKFISNSSNPGFGKACNQGLKIARGEFILFLNPDTIIPEDSFKQCLAFAKQQSNFGALGCRMIDGNGHFLPESKRLFPTAGRSFFRLTKLSRLFPKNKTFAGYHAGHLPENKNSEVDVLAGAFLFSKKETLDRLNGFDEDFFMYGEDIDLSFRIQQLKLKNFYFPEVTIIHFKGESMQKFSREHRKHFYGAMRMFVNKHYHRGIGSFIMQGGIYISSLLSSPKISKKQREYSLVAIISSNETFQQLIHFIKYSIPPLTLAGRVSLIKESNALCDISTLSHCVKKEKFDTLIFACADVSYKQAIEISADQKGTVNFLYASPNSRAIIGSNDRESRGIVILTP